MGKIFIDSFLCMLFPQESAQVTALVVTKRIENEHYEKVGVNHKTDQTLCINVWSVYVLYTYKYSMVLLVGFSNAGNTIV